MGLLLSTHVSGIPGENGPDRSKIHGSSGLDGLGDPAPPAPPGAGILPPRWGSTPARRDDRPRAPSPEGRWVLKGACRRSRQALTESHTIAGRWCPKRPSRDDPATLRRAASRQSAGMDAGPEGRDIPSPGRQPWASCTTRDPSPERALDSSPGLHRAPLGKDPLPKGTGDITELQASIGEGQARAVACCLDPLVGPITLRSRSRTRTRRAGTAHTPRPRSPAPRRRRRVSRDQARSSSRVRERVPLRCERVRFPWRQTTDPRRRCRYRYRYRRPCCRCARGAIACSQALQRLSLVPFGCRSMEGESPAEELVRESRCGHMLRCRALPKRLHNFRIDLYLETPPLQAHVGLHRLHLIQVLR